MVNNNLTKRERDVLNSLCLGESYKEIGAKLGIKPTMVVWHCQHIRDKFGARSTLHAVCIAFRTGMVEMAR